MRTTPLGYPVLSSSMRERIFGTDPVPPMSSVAKETATNLLGQFGIQVPVDYPPNLYDGLLPLPRLKGSNLKEHFETIAEEQIGRYRELGNQFAARSLPLLPPMGEVLFEPGWVRYECVNGTWQTERVPYPLEEAFTFDTETFVQEGAYPIIGTALSSKAVYLWLAKEVIDPTIPKDQWDQRNLIPIGHDRFVIGHNISYDRIRAQEGYSLENVVPENFYFDTLSAHIAVSGLAAGQRWLYVLADKDPKSLTSEERSKIRNTEWLDKGSTNSLIATYNFHVYKVKEFFEDKASPLTQDDKEIRDIFVKATHLEDIRLQLGKAVDYAIKDAFYTAELFQALWPKYLDATPSAVGLCGHYHLNGSIVPLVPDWDSWRENVERVFDEHNKEMTKICQELVWTYYDQWREIYDIDPEKAHRWVGKDPWLSQLKWEVKTIKGKYAHVPEWVRPFKKDPDAHIGVKSRLAHILLKLKWEGSPMVYLKEKGWCFSNSEGELTKIPHPKGNDENVGGVLSKDFVDDMKVGRLTSDLPEAKRALEIANSVSYWTSVRQRVDERIVISTPNPHGSNTLITLPDIRCHGTVTRRTVESLMVTMCSTKRWRIGTELKSRVRAPEGWKIVGADFDGQEMQIASIYSDKWEGGHIGCSPFGYNVLSGSKEAGTDPHSALAKLAGVDRDTAKIAGFAVLYGAGVRAVQTYIRRKYPEKSPQEVKDFASRILESKKGKLKQGLYEGGSDSGCFNYMEKIAMKSAVPTLPCLGTKISTAMRRAAVGDEFKTGRVNWTIQSSGAEILSIMLTAVHWLAKEYKIPCRFILSIHDEIWFATPERYAEQFAVLFQIAHVYTWSLFHSAVGIPDLPLSRAFFSSVAIDDRLRKTPTEDTTTLSNPKGNLEPAGVEYTMAELADIGAVKKLTTRYNAIQNGILQ